MFLKREQKYNDEQKHLMNGIIRTCFGLRFQRSVSKISIKF